MEEKEESQVGEDLIREAERLWTDPKKIMNLIDLLFMSEDPDGKKICS